MAKLFKSLVLFGLIFAVTFFALRFFQGRTPPSRVSSVAMPVEELKLLERELTVLEQAIWERRRAGGSIADEEEAKALLVGKIEKLKKEIEAALPLRALSKPAPSRGKRFRLKWGALDGTQLAVLGSLAGALLLSLLIWGFTSRGKSKGGGVPPGGARRDPRLEALKANLEKFKSKTTEMKKETAAMDLSALHAANSGGKAGAGATPAAKKGESVESKVSALSRGGAGIKEISEKLRIDEDRVRLILKFKPPSAGTDN